MFRYRAAGRTHELIRLQTLKLKPVSEGAQMVEVGIIAVLGTLLPSSLEKGYIFSIFGVSLRYRLLDYETAFESEIFLILSVSRYFRAQL